MRSTITFTLQILPVLRQEQALAITYSYPYMYFRFPCKTEDTAREISAAARAGGGGSASQPPVELAALLATMNLASFVAPLARLGVERPSDLGYITDEDLEGMRMTVIQKRKFKEIVDGAFGPPQMGGN